MLRFRLRLWFSELPNLLLRMAISLMLVLLTNQKTNKIPQKITMNFKPVHSLRCNLKRHKNTVVTIDITFKSSYS